MHNKQRKTELVDDESGVNILLEIDLLGPFAVRRDGITLDPDVWRLTHPRQLLQLLCLQPGHKLHRDLVLECLWPEGETMASSNRLYHTVHVLRRLLQCGQSDEELSPLVFKAGMLSIAPSCHLVVDLLRFRDHVAQARRCPADATLWPELEAAIARIRPAAARTAAEPPWLQQPRAAARRDQIWVLEQVAQQHEKNRRPGLAVAALNQLVELEPTNELAHCRLMTLYAAAGLPERAVGQFATCQRVLQRDLANAPSPATAALLDTITARTGIPVAHSSKANSRNRIVVLPTQVASILGRQAELALLGTWLEDTHHRLVTLTAAGGIGKTRLALALAESAQSRYRDGVLFVPLAGLRNAVQLEATICQAAGWLPSQEPPAALLHRRMADLHLLLLLDAFEQVIEAAPRVVELLTKAPELQIVVTSQCRLDSCIERVHRLAPLTLSSPLAAITLFEQTARQAGIEMRLQPIEIAAVCEQLEGNARAIEWAAGTPGALLEIPPLQPQASDDQPASTADAARAGCYGLQATLTRSVSLLNADTQHLLFSAAAFSSTFTLDQLWTVAAGSHSQSLFLESLQTLLERFLLRRVDAAAQQAGDTHFFLPASVRCHVRAADASRRCGQDVRAHHAALFAQTLDSLYAAVHADQKMKVQTDYRQAAPDIDVALVWHAEQDNLARTLQLAYQAAALQHCCGDLLAAVARLTAATSLDASTPRERQSMGWCWLGLASGRAAQGATSAAVYAARQCRRFFKENDEQFASQAFSTLAMLRASQLQFRSAEFLLARAADTGPGTSGKRTQALAALQVGCVRQLQGRYAEALKLAAITLRTAAMDDCQPVMCSALQSMSRACVGYGNVQRAKNHLDECQLIAQQALAENIDAYALLLDRFYVAFECHDAVKAQQHLDEAVALPAADRPLGYGVTVKLALEFLRMESTDVLELDQLPVIALATLPPNVNLMTFCFKRQCYRLRLTAQAGHWAMANDTLARLTVTVLRSKNLLWAAWAEEAMGYTWLALGQVALARAQLTRARWQPPACVRVATPRQQASWQRLERLIEQDSAQGVLPRVGVEARKLGAQLGSASVALAALGQLQCGQQHQLSALPG